jgi:hypothetical protein
MARLRSAARQGGISARLRRHSRDCCLVRQQKPLPVCMLSTSSMPLPMHARCGADGMALVEAEMDEDDEGWEAPTGVGGRRPHRGLDIVAYWDGERCSAVRAPASDE